MKALLLLLPAFSFGCLELALLGQIASRNWENDSSLLPDDIDGYSVGVTHFNSSNPQLVPDGQYVGYNFDGYQVFGDGSDNDALSQFWEYTVTGDNTATIIIDFGGVGSMKYYVTATSTYGGDCTFEADDSRYDTIYGSCSYTIEGGNDSGYYY